MALTPVRVTGKYLSTDGRSTVDPTKLIALPPVLLPGEQYVYPVPAKLKGGGEFLLPLFADSASPLTYVLTETLGGSARTLSVTVPAGASGELKLANLVGYSQPSGAVLETSGKASVVSLRATFEAPLVLRTPAPFRLNAANRVAAGTFFYRPIGVDPTGGIMWFFRNGSAIFQTDNYGTTFSAGRALPANVSASNVSTVCKLGASVYMLALETTGNTYSVYRATHVAQGGNWTDWSGILTSMRTGATSLAHLSLIATAWGSNDVLVLSEYGDPTGGPVIKVSSDGTTWNTTFGPDAGVRHIHHVNWDPYNPGHLWATLGDGTTKTLMRSTNYGQTWAVVVVDSAWQGVQISFTQTHVYLAGDSLQTSVVRVDKATLIPEVPASGYHHDIVPPHIGGGGRRITDLVTVVGNAQVTSATAAFVAGDKGKYVISPNLPPRSYITGVVNGTTVNLSQAPHIAATAAAQISGDMYFANAFYGAVDPASGIYYGVAVDTSSPGTVHGVFFLPRTGEQMKILDAGGIGIHPWGPTCVIAGGYLWVGSLKYPLLATASVPV